ncbi:DUF4404 family protein [Planctomicrobium sp. SH664]|uniref:DUF4404 family protein n=1 Tax=Planctomicrobium sp. SH664 TaxID=3448125 RepID=UPI003F5B6BD3
MERDRLIETLNELRQHLKSGGQLDPESRQLLQDLSEQVDQLTVQSEEESKLLALSAEEKESLLDRMLGLTEEFEASHPQLAEAIGNVASALSRIGI